jgi:glycosyltransferase involved in cell wall biosynthesis
VRIGIFSESYEPVLNGVTVSILTLTSALKELGHEVYVFAPRYPGHVDVENEVFRFPSVRTWVAPDYPLAIPYLPQITRRVRGLNLDVIHTHTPFMLGSLGLRLGRKLGIPVVSTNHTQYAEYVHYFTLAPRATARRFVIGHMKRYYNRCDGVIVPSAPIADLLREYGVRTPIYVIPTGNALDTCTDLEARRELRTRYGIPADAQVLLYVGRLAKEKNLDLLFRAFDRLRARHPGLRLAVVGGGPYEAGCKSLAAELGCSDAVAFTGCIPREKVAKYYSIGDIFAFPSTTETQGLVLNEALGAGLPCVAVNAGGSAEVLLNGKAGLLTEDNVDDFAAKIDALLNDREMMERFSDEAVSSAFSFSPADMAARALEVYETVRSSSHSRAESVAESGT